MQPLRPYGPTAARAHDTSQSRPSGVATIDIHAHMMVVAAQQIVDRHPDIAAVPVQAFSNPTTDAVNARQVADRRVHLTSLEQRLADMDSMGLDQQVVIPAPPQSFYWKPAGPASEALHLINEAIADTIRQVPDRLIGFGALPMQDTELAVAELEHCVRDLGFKGVQVLTNVNGEELSAQRFEPFWAKAEELGTVVFLHPNGIPDGNRLKDHYFINVVGNPYDTSLCVHHLIFDGVLERHPKLRILLAHGGGYLAAYCGRIDHAWGAREDCRLHVPQAPTTYLKRLYLDTIVFTPHQLKYLVDVFGADHIALGTDYAYDMGEYDPVGHILSTDGLNEAQIADLLSGTARRLLKL